MAACAIFEIMSGDSQKSGNSFSKESMATEIRKAAISQGMSTLYIDGLRKAMGGVTTLEEVYRVAKRTEQDILPVD